MLSYVYHALEDFRSCFSRPAQLAIILCRRGKLSGGPRDDGGHVDVSALALG